MQFKTRNHISPQGLPKVYVTGHADNFARHFEHIKNALLKFSNCAVFYDTDPENPEDKENFFDMLESVQLVVLAVTRRFVYEDCFAFLQVFRFAAEKHIPVLPILEESGIEEDFNKKCGDIQLLNPFSRDPTQISFEDKLKQYLDAIIVGDETAGEIRASFSAYVFLSYRKKDREHAQKLMRLIHKNDFCRDVAIWYDEFLVPGENFNRAIAGAMKKSRLFALAVTPNLLEKNNYVMTTEYPEATKAGLPIMPVEFVNTDNDKLQEKYPAIPIPLEHTDISGIKTMLEQILTLDSSNNNDPRHMFLIGSAYLSGIDVEVDQRRAVELITAAAEKDLIEAVEKLVGMYHEGAGVVRDHTKAIEWQKRLVELREKRFHRKWHWINAGKWTLAQHKLGEYAEEIGHYSEAADIYKNELHNLGELLQIFHNSWFQRRIEICWCDLGGVCEKSGDLENAKKWYELFLSKAENKAEENNSDEAMADLSYSYSRIGDICLAQGDISAAKARYEKDLVINESLAAKDDSPYIRNSLAVSCIKLGDVCKKQNDLSSAKEWYEKALVIFEVLEKENDYTNPDRKLSVIYDRMGDICEWQGDLGGAEKWYEKAFSVAESITAKSDSVEVQRDVFISHNKLGDICKRKGNLEGAKAQYEKALSIAGKIAAKSDSAKAKSDLAYSLSRLGGICERQGDLGGAEEWYEKALCIYEELAAKTGLAEAQSDLALSYKNIGDVNSAKGDLKAAAMWYEKALYINEELAAKTGSAEAQSDLLTVLRKLATNCQERDDIEGAEEYYERGLVLAENVSQQSDNPIECALLYLGTSQFHSGRKRQRLLQKAEGLIEQAVRQFPESTAFKQLLEEVRLEIRGQGV